MRTYRPKFKWEYLKEVKCPKEGANLMEEQRGYKCVYGECGFFITRQRFDEVVKDLYRPRRPGTPYRAPAEDNSAELNNLETGRRRSAFEGMSTGEEYA